VRLLGRGPGRTHALCQENVCGIVTGRDHLVDAVGQRGLRLRASGYLTIEEVARKLCRPDSWVKGHILDGKLGATLSGRRWLIAPKDFEELLLINPPPPEPSQTVHNFLPERPAKKPSRPQRAQKAPVQARTSKRAQQSNKSPSSRRVGSMKKSKGKRPLLTQRIKDLDHDFDQLCTRLQTEMLKYKVAVKSGKKVGLPTSLLREWKATRAELLFLLAKARAKGLVLPADLSVNKMHTQRSDDWSPPKQPTSETPKVVGGIEGYYAGPGQPEKRHWFNEED
jgi:hypothetical protein